MAANSRSQSQTASSLASPGPTVVPGASTSNWSRNAIASADPVPLTAASSWPRNGRRHAHVPPRRPELRWTCNIVSVLQRPSGFRHLHDGFVALEPFVLNHDHLECNCVCVCIELWESRVFRHPAAEHLVPSDHSPLKVEQLNHDIFA